VSAAVFVEADELADHAPDLHPVAGMEVEPLRRLPGRCGGAWVELAGAPPRAFARSRVG
jgi:hypothetical protein